MKNVRFQPEAERDSLGFTQKKGNLVSEVLLNILLTQKKIGVIIQMTTKRGADT